MFRIIANITLLVFIFIPLAARAGTKVQPAKAPSAADQQAAHRFMETNHLIEPGEEASAPAGSTRWTLSRVLPQKDGLALYEMRLREYDAAGKPVPGIGEPVEVLAGRNARSLVKFETAYPQSTRRVAVAVVGAAGEPDLGQYCTELSGASAANVRKALAVHAEGHEGFFQASWSRTTGRLTIRNPAEPGASPTRSPSSHFVAAIAPRCWPSTHPSSTMPSPHTLGAGCTRT